MLHRHLNHGRQAEPNTQLSDTKWQSLEETLEIKPTEALGVRPREAGSEPLVTSGEMNEWGQKTSEGRSLSIIISVQ